MGRRLVPPTVVPRQGIIGDGLSFLPEYVVHTGCLFVPKPVHAKACSCSFKHCVSGAQYNACFAARMISLSLHVRSVVGLQLADADVH